MMLPLGDNVASTHLPGLSTRVCVLRLQINESLKTPLFCCHLIDSRGSAVQKPYYTIILEPKQKEMVLLVYVLWQLIRNPKEQNICLLLLGKYVILWLKKTNTKQHEIISRKR